MSELTMFTFEGGPVRVVTIDGEPWFVGKDVAERLGYSDPSTAIRSHCRGVQKLHPLQTSSGMQDLRILAEPDVLRLIVKSNLPSAVRFEAKVFDEILPTIRKTGTYGGAPTIDVRDPSQLAMIAMQLISVNKELETRATTAEARVEAAKPKTEFFDQFVNADGLYGYQNAGRALGCRPNMFVKFLKKKYVFYQGNALVPYTQYIHSGLFEVKPDMHNGEVHLRGWITPKGLEYFSKRIPPEIRMPVGAGGCRENASLFEGAGA